MSISNHKNNVSFKELIVEFNYIKTSAFSGNIIVQIADTPSWILFFSSGRLAGISGGIDEIDRWKRSLALASFHVPLDRLVKSTNNEEVFLNSNKFAQEWAVKEILFDIIQFCRNNGNQISYQINPITKNNPKLSSGLPLVDIQPLLHQTIQDWQEWETSKLARFSPSFFPVIEKPEIISQFDDQNFQYLIASIDGNRSLRSIAIHHQQKLIDVTVSLLPLLKLGIINLVAPPESKPEINALDSSSGKDLSTDATLDLARNSNDELSPLIACIDDSLLACKGLEKILTDQGYRCVGIQDPIKILPTLIKTKPDLIFLDLVMPINNGYEVCEQIRKTPCLANIPIVILTGNDGFIDRVRTKFVGANGFLSKPARAESVLKMVDKYLSKNPPSGTLDAVAPIPATQSPSEPILQKLQLDMPSNSGKRILVVDDDDHIREVVSMCLHKLKGWKISTAASGQEGLDIARTHKPDAIVLDVMMPNMDGLAFLRLLRSDPATNNIPVVLLTANLYLPARQLLTELGVAEIVSKPFMPVQLVQQIDRVF